MNHSFDDLEIGEIDRFGRYEVTREEVIAFASRYDPQGFHIDDEAAANSIFGRIAASGWHTAAMAMRMMADRRRETGAADNVMGGAGLDELKWLRPVYPGDTLTMQIEIVAKTPSRSKPDRGIVKTRWTVFNQHEEPVMTTITNIMVRRREA